MDRRLKFKKGAASFYVVAFSTLILLIVVASFAALIISQITRSSNADLSQSAYDSALAGVEDAKLAFANYKACVEQGAEAKKPGEGDTALSCGNIVWYMNSVDGEYKEYNTDCVGVAKILGRTINEDNSVTINEGENNNMEQAYTCVKVYTALPNIRDKLAPSKRIKTIKAKFGNGVKASDIDYVVLRWGKMMSSSDPSKVGSKLDSDSKHFAFEPSATPPTLSLSLLQTGANFSIDDFEKVDLGGARTNRGMVYLIPTNADNAKMNQDGNDSSKSFIGAYDGNQNQISKAQVVKSNDKTKQNMPFAVYCSAGETAEEYACSVRVNLPEPYNSGVRNDDTFMLTVAMPYGNESTDIDLEYYCKDGSICHNEEVIGSEEQEIIEKNRVIIVDTQVGIDSTGRANDLFRRVESRIERSESMDLSIMGPLELIQNNSLGNTNSTTMDKQLIVTCERNFPPMEGC